MVGISIIAHRKSKCASHDERLLRGPGVSAGFLRGSAAGVAICRTPLDCPSAASSLPPRDASRSRFLVTHLAGLRAEAKLNWLSWRLRTARSAVPALLSTTYREQAAPLTPSQTAALLRQPVMSPIQGSRPTVLFPDRRMNSKRHQRRDRATGGSPAQPGHCLAAPQPTSPLPSGRLRPTCGEAGPQQSRKGTSLPAPLHASDLLGQPPPTMAPFALAGHRWPCAAGQPRLDRRLRPFSPSRAISSLLGGRPFFGDLDPSTQVMRVSGRAGCACPPNGLGVGILLSASPPSHMCVLWRSRTQYTFPFPFCGRRQVSRSRFRVCVTEKKAEWPAIIMSYSSPI